MLEKTPSEAYAPYFGLDIENLRLWFELQFTEGINWDNFGKAWQFDHIVPTTYFDYSKEEDLVLCWNFINIRIERTDTDNSGTNRIEELAVKSYFRNLYEKTGFSLCQKMLEKIEAIESDAQHGNSAIERFMIDNKDKLENITTLIPEEFNRLNKGNTVEELLLEREILRKFGSGQKP